MIFFFKFIFYYHCTPSCSIGVVSGLGKGLCSLSALVEVIVPGEIDW